MTDDDEVCTDTAVTVVPATDDSSLSLLLYLDGAVQAHPLDGDAPVQLGRLRSNSISIDDPSVSRHHATLILAPLALVDAGSRNGTRIRGEVIQPGEPTPFAPGDIIQLGDVVMLVQPRAIPTLDTARAPSPWTSLEHRLVEESARSARSGAPFAHLRLLVAAHQAGAARAALTAALRASDVLSEDEAGAFQLLLPDTGAERGVVAMHRLVGALAAIGVPSRPGLAIYPQDGSTGEQLSARAWQLATTSGGGGGGVTAMDEVRAVLARIAPSNLAVLITGETGVGKELYAEMLHRSSDRAARPFIRLNCAAIAESLLEAELFGHERGAFTGATTARTGLFEAADGGTLFLDEIGELSLGIQSTLLRVLEEGRVRPIGSNAGRPIDVRFVCATNRVLADEIAARRFRNDLYFRISGVTLALPPLRERRDEIAGLIRAFASRAQRPLQPPPRLTAAAIELLERAPWPGNVRELRNTIERAVLLAGGAEIEPRHLVLETAPALPPQASSVEDTIDRPRRPTMPRFAELGAPPTRLADAVADTERQHILEVLAICGGNQTRAAQLLGISRNTLLARLDEFGITRPRKKL